MSLLHNAGAIEMHPPLTALRAFEVASRHGSFSAAAEELCVTQSAVSHQIRIFITYNINITINIIII